MKVSFTGHRPDKTKNPTDAKAQLLKALLTHLGDLHVHTYVVGGAPGFDTLALELLLEQKIDKSKIVLAVPFRGFEKFAGYKHPQENMLAYNLNYTCGVMVLEVGGTQGKFSQKCLTRNQYLVDNCEIIFTNWDGSSSGGTAHTVRLAHKKKVQVVNLNKVEK